MKRKTFAISLLLIMAVIFQSCDTRKNMLSTREVIVTSESGDKMAVKENVRFVRGTPEGTVIRLEPEVLKQTMDGIGSSFTEASAFVLAHLDPAARKEVMNKLFSEGGANFSLARTHIGACDFTVKGRYSYLDKVGDTGLESFTVAPDKEGFSSSEYPGIKDEGYDLLPMIKEALEIKNLQADKDLRIVASAWTAPSWMKDIEDWYIRGSAENNYQGTGGTLKEKYEETYADYLIRYLDVYRSEGVDIWAITPVNEPHGVNGQWESMIFTPQTQNEFIKKFLGPKLKSGDNSKVNLLIYDQNRDGMQQWTDVILADSLTSGYVYGTAVHWYESTYKVYEDVFDAVNARFPDHKILHTEGCIDDLGKPAPQGIADPERFTEKDWFDNDSFWWNENATDWAYTAEWAGEGVKDHPAYTPVHRYARNIIVSIDHWLAGWIDWNVVLDHKGGPNHVGNNCGAPVMINTETGHIYYTPVYYVLAQFSKTIRPGDRAIQTYLSSEMLGDDDLHACATVNSENVLSVQLLNTTKKDISCKLQIGDQYADVTIVANSVQTVRVQL